MRKGSYSEELIRIVRFHVCSRDEFDGWTAVAQRCNIKTPQIQVCSPPVTAQPGLRSGGCEAHPAVLESNVDALLDVWDRLCT